MTDAEYQAVVERVARAMHDEDCEHPWPKYSEWYKNLATAALSALGLRELVEALEFYGTAENYHEDMEVNFPFRSTKVEHDRGDRARTALASLKGAQDHVGVEKS